MSEQQALTRQGESASHQHSPEAAKRDQESMRHDGDSISTTSFPRVATILWSRLPQGQSTVLQLSAPVVYVSNTTLQVTARLAHEGAKPVQSSVRQIPAHAFEGFLAAEIGYNATSCLLEMVVQRFDQGRRLDDGNLIPTVPVFGQALIPIKSADADVATAPLVHTMRKDYRRSLADAASFKDLHVPMEVRLQLLADGGSTHAVIASFAWNALVPSVRFKATPILPVRVVKTALFRRLSLVSSPQTEFETGFLTMNETRQVIFVLEEDRAVPSTPLVGIFVSGAVSVSDPRVVLACLRYLAASHVRNRVFVDKAHFLMCFHVNRAGIAYTDWFEMVALADDLFSADLCVVRHETTLKATQTQSGNVELVFHPTPKIPSNSTKPPNARLGSGNGSVSRNDDDDDDDDACEPKKAPIPVALSHAPNGGIHDHESENGRTLRGTLGQQQTQQKRSDAVTASTPSPEAPSLASRLHAEGNTSSVNGSALSNTAVTPQPVSSRAHISDFSRNSHLLDISFSASTPPHAQESTRAKDTSASVATTPSSIASARTRVTMEDLHAQIMALQEQVRSLTASQASLISQQLNSSDNSNYTTHTQAPVTFQSPPVKSQGASRIPSSIKGTVTPKYTGVSGVGKAAERRADGKEGWCIPTLTETSVDDADQNETTVVHSNADEEGQVAENESALENNAGEEKEGAPSQSASPSSVTLVQDALSKLLSAKTLVAGKGHSRHSSKASSCTEEFDFSASPTTARRKPTLAVDTTASLSEDGRSCGSRHPYGIPQHSPKLISSPKQAAMMASSRDGLTRRKLFFAAREGLEVQVASTPAGDQGEGDTMREAHESSHRHSAQKDDSAHPLHRSSAGNFRALTNITAAEQEVRPQQHFDGDGHGDEEDDDDANDSRVSAESCRGRSQPSSSTSSVRITDHIVRMPKLPHHHDLASLDSAQSSGTGKRSTHTRPSTRTRTGTRRGSSRHHHQPLPSPHAAFVYEDSSTQPTDDREGSLGSALRPESKNNATDASPRDKSGRRHGLGAVHHNVRSLSKREVHLRAQSIVQKYIPQ